LSFLSGLSYILLPSPFISIRRLRLPALARALRALSLFFGVVALHRSRSAFWQCGVIRSFICPKVELILLRINLKSSMRSPLPEEHPKAR
jgi:hypothetical protein